MPKSRAILIVTSAVFFGAVILVLAGVVPGRYEGGENPQNQKGEVMIWSADDTQDAFASSIQSFTERSRNVRVNFVGFSDPIEYEETLLNALASGKGPDIFSFPNSDLDRFASKLYPIPPAALPVFQFRNLYPETAERDLVRGGLVYGLPVSIDTLALFYNKDHFNESALVFPPADWDQFREFALALVRYDNAGEISRAGAGLGGPNSRIAHGTDILEFIGLQNAAQTGAGFGLNQPPLASALDFYTGFARRGFNYIWSDRLPYSLDGFASGKISMILGYGSDLANIRRLNGLLKIGVAPAPQPASVRQIVTYARYGAYGISNFSKDKALALRFLLSLAASPTAGRAYVAATGRPPALRSLIQEYIGDPELDVFARQALTAVSWPKVDSPEVGLVLSEAIQTVARGAVPSVALSVAEAKYQRAIGVYGR